MWTDTLAELKAIFAKAVTESRGNILLPAFSVGRAQGFYIYFIYILKIGIYLAGKSASIVQWRLRQHGYMLITIR